MDRREQGRGRENQNPELGEAALPEDRSREVSFGSLLIDFETYVRAYPHETERLLATMTAIAFQNGGLSPDSFPPPPVDEFGRVGLPPAKVPLAPYKAEYLARYRGYKIVNGEPVAIMDEERKPAESPEPIRVNYQDMLEQLFPKSDPSPEPERRSPDGHIYEDLPPWDLIEQLDKHIPKSDSAPEPVKTEAEQQRAPTREELLRGFIKAFDDVDPKAEESEP